MSPAKKKKTKDEDEIIDGLDEKEDLEEGGDEDESWEELAEEELKGDGDETY